MFQRACSRARINSNGKSAGRSKHVGYSTIRTTSQREYEANDLPGIFLMKPSRMNYSLCSAETFASSLPFTAPVFVKMADRTRHVMDTRCIAQSIRFSGTCWSSSSPLRAKNTLSIFVSRTALQGSYIRRRRAFRGRRGFLTRAVIVLGSFRKLVRQTCRGRKVQFEERCVPWSA